MQYAETSVAGFTTRTWEQASRSTKATEDAALVTVVGDCLHLAAIDGCTSGINTPTFGTMTGAALATSILRGFLSQPIGPTRAFNDANSHLLDQFEALPLRSRPMSAAVAAELDLRSGSVLFAGAGDCEFWVRSNNQWQRHFGGAYLSGDLREAVDHLALDCESLDELLRQEEALLAGASPEEIVSPLVGMQRQLAAADETINEWDQLVLASDGARLNADRVANLEGWLAGLRQWETSEEAATEVQLSKPHDDVTVVSVTR